MLGYCLVHDEVLLGCMVGAESAQSNIEYTHLARSARTRATKDVRRRKLDGICTRASCTMTTHTRKAYMTKRGA